MKRAFIGVAAILLVLSLASCRDTNTAAAEKGTELLFYYSAPEADYSGAAIQSETDRLESVTVPAVLKRLFEKPQNSELIQLIPDGTSVLDWCVSDGVLELDLSEEFSSLSGASLIQAEYCIVLTVTQLDSVDAVSITAEGRKIPENKSRFLRASDVLLDGTTDDPVTVEVTLYYPLQDGSGLETEKREIEMSSLSPLDQANAVLEALSNSSNLNTDKIDVYLDGVGTMEAVSEKNGVCKVSIDAAVMEKIYGNDDQSELRIYAIVDSLTELADIDQVIFLLDGETTDGLQTSYSARYEF